MFINLTVKEDEMLKVQEYLKGGKTFDDLSKELGIACTFHPTEPLVTINYDQIESPKSHPVVRECRGLVLHKDTFDVIAKSFNRFFNIGEMIDEFKDFDFSNFVVDEKVDGSLVSIYKYNGKVRINTRGSFAQGNLEGYDGTWEHAISSALGDETKKKIEEILNSHPYLTLVCEYCSLYNKIVRNYNTPTVYLLTVFDYCDELDWNKTDYIAGQLGMKRPIRYEFKSIEQIEKFVNEIGDTDATFEGVVIRDINGNRWKLKNSRYISLHRLKGNGNVFLYKNLLPFALSGESAELLTYYPEAEERYRYVESKVNESFADLKKTFLESKEIIDQKTFALSIKGKTPFTSILFTLKKKFGKDATEKDLKELWRDSGDMILKVLFD